MPCKEAHQDPPSNPSRYLAQMRLKSVKLEPKEDREAAPATLDKDEDEPS